MPSKRKAINFDLDTKKLETVYSVQTGKSPNTAYDDLKRFFKSHNFDWRQGSGYTSQHPLPYTEVFSLVEDAKEKFPWLSECVKKFDVTDIGKYHDLTSIIKGDKTPPTKKQQRESVLGSIKNIQKQQAQQNRPPSPNRKKDLEL